MVVPGAGIAERASGLGVRLEAVTFIVAYNTVLEAYC
jgi:hypothetical protein